MKVVLDSERRQRKLHHAQRSALQGLVEHWDGLTVFLGSPQIPMDNNGSERILRTPVVGRRNYYGSVTHWSPPAHRGARFAAVMFSIFETLALWEINELEWLSDYLRSCGLAGGTAPQDISPHLPWNIRKEHERTWTYSGRTFSESELETMRAIIDEDTTGMRTPIARRACEQLGWYRDDGELKTASMAKVLTAVEADALIEIPPSRATSTARVRAKPPQHTERTEPEEPISAAAGELARDLRIEIAETDERKALWNEYVDRYHCLG